MRVIIAGSRDFNDYELLRNKCDNILSASKGITVVSGAARGADRLGERYARERGYTVRPFPANWTKYSNSAGYIRNREMAEYADALIAFWDGKSDGTVNMISLAIDYKLKLRIIYYETGNKEVN